jgi:hypothetical protein
VIPLAGTLIMDIVRHHGSRELGNGKTVCSESDRVERTRAVLYT